MEEVMSKLKELSKSNKNRTGTIFSAIALLAVALFIGVKVVLFLWGLVA